MKIEIVDAPFRRELVGKLGRLEGKTKAAKGFELMGLMWPVVKARAIKNRGLNHWVYLPDDTLFTGVELDGVCDDLGGLERIEIELPRFLRHVHVGPYSGIPGCWERLMKHVKDAGETPAFPNVEIYGHWIEDESKLETTILIRLRSAAV